MQANVDPESLEDRVMAQMPPVNTYGNTFIVMPLNSADTLNYVKFVASNDDTTVVLSSQNDVILIEAGDTGIVEITSPTFIEASNPVLAMLFVEYLDLGASSAVLTPVTQYQYGYQFITVSDSRYTSYLTVTVDDRYRDTIRVDGDSISSNTWQSASSSDYVVAVIELDGSAQHYVYSESEAAQFGAIVHSVSNECGLVYSPGMCLNVVSMKNV